MLCANSVDLDLEGPDFGFGLGPRRRDQRSAKGLLALDLALKRTDVRLAAFRDALAHVEPSHGRAISPSPSFFSSARQASVALPKIFANSDLFLLRDIVLALSQPILRFRELRACFADFGVDSFGVCRTITYAVGLADELVFPGCRLIQKGFCLRDLGLDPHRHGFNQDTVRGDEPPLDLTLNILLEQDQFE